jgi:hypothetical protein
VAEPLLCDEHRSGHRDLRSHAPDCKLEGLCDTIEELLARYARTSDQAYIKLASIALRGLAEARRRPEIAKGRVDVLM